MLEWLLKLFRDNEPTVEPYPTPDTVDEWDDASLLATVGCDSAIRYHNDGFEALNSTERVLCCFCLIESNINNGGVGQWIDGLCPLSAKETPRALQDIGATEMAAFLKAALDPLGDTTAIPSRTAWVDHCMSMPDDVHEKWESLTHRYLSLEVEFLELAYRYVRRHWEQVRQITKA